MVLVRNADSIAVSNSSFAFQQKVEQFFCLLQCVPRAAEPEREEVRPFLKSMLAHASIQSRKILQVGARDVIRSRLVSPPRF